jgi:hypothetical protein
MSRGQLVMVIALLVLVLLRVASAADRPPNETPYDRGDVCHGAIC